MDTARTSTHQDRKSEVEINLRDEYTIDLDRVQDVPLAQPLERLLGRDKVQDLEAVEEAIWSYIRDQDVVVPVPRPKITDSQIDAVWKTAASKGPVFVSFEGVEMDYVDVEQLGRVKFSDVFRKGKIGDTEFSRRLESYVSEHALLRDSKG
jgi:hypothetical protein